MILNDKLNKFLFFFLLRPKITIISFIIAAFFSLFYAYENIVIVTDTDKLISNELPFKKKQKELKQKFPILSNNIVIVLESKDGKLLKIKTNEILKALEKNSERLDFFFSPNFDEFYKKNSLLLVSESKRDEIINKLYAQQPFISEIINNPRLKGLNNLLDLSLKNLKSESSPKDQKSIKKLNDTILIFNKSLSEKNKVVWKEVFSENILRNFIFLKINDKALLNNQFSHIYKLINEFQKKSDGNLNISFTGGLALDYEEADSVVKGASKSGFLSILVVFIILFLAFRNLILIALLVITIILGLFITLGLTTFFIGSLNIISVAFAVLFIGISVDFGIQFCLRSYEHKNYSPKNIQLAVKNISFSLFIVSITSIIGFLSFVPTDYKGLSELGIISSIGLLVGLIANIIFLPSCCIILNKKIKSVSVSKKLFFFEIHKAILKKSNFFLIFLVFVLASGIFLMRFINFDSDPMKLKDQKSQSVILALKLMEQNPSSDYTISVFKKEIDNKKIEELLKNDIIKNIFRLNSLEFSDEIKDELEYLNFLYKKEKSYFFSDYSELKKLKQILNKVINLDIKPISVNAELLLKKLEKINSSEDFKKVQNLWFENFDELFLDITRLINIDSNASGNIPELFMKRYISDDGYERIEVIPAKNLQNRENLSEFVTYVKSYFPEATGMPIIQFEAGNVVVNSFIFALTTSVFFLLIFIYLIFRKLKIVLLCILPLIFSVIFASTLMRILQIDLNFANMISLPLLFSLGTSYSIYIIKRSVDLRSIDKTLKSSTPNAVFFSGLTTIGSFAMLSFSSHNGTSSMGILLFISLFSALFSCLIILPVMIKKIKLTI